MNRADKMLSVLNDGRAHTRNDIWRTLGEFIMTNNAADELRDRGLHVVFDKKQDTYQLRSSLDETQTSDRVAPLRHAPAPPACVSSNEDGLSIPRVSLLGEADSADEHRTRGGGVLVLFSSGSYREGHAA